jgi:hypothetical protein
MLHRMQMSCAVEKFHGSNEIITIDEMDIKFQDESFVLRETKIP